MHMWNVYNTFLYEIFLQVLIYFLPLEKCKSIITSNLKNLHSKLGKGKYKEYFYITLILLSRNTPRFLGLN